MLPTALLSMWISNTASTAMMVKNDDDDDDDDDDDNDDNDETSPPILQQIPILEAVVVELGPEHRHLFEYFY